MKGDRKREGGKEGERVGWWRGSGGNREGWKDGEREKECGGGV